MTANEEWSEQELELAKAAWRRDRKKLVRKRTTRMLIVLAGVALIMIFGKGANFPTTTASNPELAPIPWREMPPTPAKVEMKYSFYNVNKGYSVDQHSQYFDTMEQCQKSRKFLKDNSPVYRWAYCK